MDSGIESTESSNCSLNEVSFNDNDGMNYEPLNKGIDARTNNPAGDEMKDESNSSSQSWDAWKPPGSANKRNGQFDEKDFFDESKVTGDNEQCEKNNFSIPEGSRLQLHFPLQDSISHRMSEQVLSDLEPLPGLTFANISPSLYLGPGYEEYAQGYAVLPYEKHDIQRKCKSKCRLKSRQSISTKPKERKLRVAAGLNNVERVENLLAEGVDPKCTDDKQRTPLHIAASKGYTQIVKLLLEHGADPNQTDAIGNTPLHLAACTSHIETVTQLLKAGTNVKQADNQGYSPLHLAHSRLHILQRDSNAPSVDLKKQVYQIVEMMQTYLECAGNTQEAELLTELTDKLTLSDSRPEVENDLQALLNSLQDLDLTKSKKS